MRSSEIPIPTGLTSPGLPAAKRSIRFSIRAAAWRSFSFLSQLSNDEEVLTSTMVPTVVHDWMVGKGYQCLDAARKT